MATKRAKGRKRVTIELQDDKAREVFVAGTFNDWNPAAKPLKSAGENGCYKATLMLPKGRHEYKFVIDGTWCNDPTNPASVTNSLGSQNSVLVVE